MNDDMEVAPSDSFPQPGDAIRAKWVMDGSTTLAQAAERLEAFASQLRDLHAQGWTLSEPVRDDYGFLVSPDGRDGREDEHEGFDEELDKRIN